MAYLSLHPHRGTPMPMAGTRRARPGLFARALDTLRLWRQRVEQRDALSRLTDRDLRDMRVTPYEVGLEIRKPFWRD
ncbi:MAG TPA: DUF1127 domain-containing protein [Crenalkalicoccus sp.]|nr:DUF1127 domain-containing protein [Crenalkalicoccus sp.]